MISHNFSENISQKNKKQIVRNYEQLSSCISKDFPDQFLLQIRSTLSYNHSTLNTQQNQTIIVDCMVTYHARYESIKYHKSLQEHQYENKGLLRSHLFHFEVI